MNSALPQFSPPAGPADDILKDVDLATFMADVIEASKQHIIVTYFWVARAAPCKQLSDVLEKVIRSYKGSVKLVRVDVEKNPEIAQQMGVQAVPAVFAFYHARPVDGFQGVLPEPQIKNWIERLFKATGAPASDEAESVEEALKHAADYMAAGDLETAQAVYVDILDMDPKNAAAYAGLLRCLMASGDTAKAKEMFEKASTEIAKDKAMDSVRTALELAAQSEQAAPLADLQAKVEKDANDHQARFDLAMAHYAAGQKEQAVDQLLEIVRRNRSWNEEAARKQLVKLFEAFGPMDPLTIASRKRLSSILFS